MTTSTSMLTENDMQLWGERIGRDAAVPLVLALHGDLGAGKTTLARAIARGLGIDGPVPSPTYNLLFRYGTPRGMGLAHLDLYRLEAPEEVWDLGWDELPAEGEMVLIEWPERAGDLLPEPRWRVELEEVGDPGLRRVTLTPVGSPPPLPPLPGDRA